MHVHGARGRRPHARRPLAGDEGPRDRPAGAGNGLRLWHGRVPDADPLGGSGLDLLEVRQTNAASPLGYDVLGRYTSNATHQVLTATDAAGETTTYTYTAEGQKDVPVGRALC